MKKLLFSDRLRLQAMYHKWLSKMPEQVNDCCLTFIVFLQSFGFLNEGKIIEALIKMYDRSICTDCLNTEICETYKQKLSVRDCPNYRGLK